MENKLTKILCPIDFSKYSEHVIAWGKMLCETFGASLIIFHAIPPERQRFFPAKRIDQAQRIKNAEESIKELMQKYPLEWHSIVLAGDPVIETAKAAQHHGVDLVIVASHGFSGFKRVVIGSVVERMSREMTTPLLILRCHAMSDNNEIINAGSKQIPAFTNIVTACDLKEDSLSAARHGFLFAEWFRSRLFLVHTVESPATAEKEDKIDDSYSTMQEKLQAHIKYKLLAHLLVHLPENRGKLPEQSSRGPKNQDQKNQDQKNSAKWSHISYVIPKVLTGNPGEEIPAFALENGAELIVVGVRHRTVIGKLLTGSTTENIIRNAPCHVLTVPEKKSSPIIPKESILKTKTDVVLDRRYLEHETPHGHPESPKRLEPLFNLMESLEITLPINRIQPRYASENEITLVHSQEYLNKIKNTSTKEYTTLNPETHMCSKSYETALLAAGGVFEALDRLFKGTVENSFVLARPPGHHAEKNRAMGFCVFNNIALGAVYAKKKFGISRILIVDWDVHHGNGTHHIFERDPSVLFFSIHQRHHYPGSGLFSEAGLGPGEGYTVNIPLPKGYGDAEYAAMFTQLLKPMALEFNPELILVSAGFDIHQSDFLGGMNLTSQGFADLTRAVMDLSKECRAKLMLVLEGGYHTQSFVKSISAVLKELCSETRSNPALTAQRAPRKKIKYALHRTIHVHKHFWKCWRDYAG